MTPTRNEIRFQNHIIDSYAMRGGHAQKWASEWQANKPDLICSLPGIGLHLLEVKHVPVFESVVRNCLTKGQQIECQKYLNGGAWVWAAVVSGASDARGSYLGLLDTQAEMWHYDKAIWVPYKLGYKFDVLNLVHRTIMWESYREK